MNKIRIAGLIILIIAIFGIFYFERSGFDLLFGILAGIGIGWLLTGKFIAMSKSQKE
jgi:uncharacterized membrane protein